MVKSAIAHERDQTKAKNDSISLQSIQNNMLTSVIIITIIITTIVINKKKKKPREEGARTLDEIDEKVSPNFFDWNFFFFFFLSIKLASRSRIFQTYLIRKQKLTSLPHKQMVISSLFFLEKKQQKRKRKENKNDKKKTKMQESSHPILNSISSSQIQSGQGFGLYFVLSSKS